MKICEHLWMFWNHRDIWLDTVFVFGQIFLQRSSGYKDNQFWISGSVMLWLVQQHLTLSVQLKEYG